MKPIEKLVRDIKNAISQLRDALSELIRLILKKATPHPQDNMDLRKKPSKNHKNINPKRLKYFEQIKKSRYAPRSQSTVSRRNHRVQRR